ncbi:MAG: ribonuclease III, partial [Deltaproteobacteria bacterium]|nr:ribonuclease III [Deltaproteobacteria bacterium]
THRSFKNERPDIASTDNERLEFLGDAVVGLVVASLLYVQFPDSDEGELRKSRAAARSRGCSRAR